LPAKNNHRLYLNVASRLWLEVMVRLGPGQWRRNLQKVSPPRPLFQLRRALPPRFTGSGRCCEEFGPASDHYFFLPQRAAAALRAISRRLLVDEGVGAGPSSGFLRSPNR